MISIRDKFLINEGILSWMRNSISNVLGRRQMNKLGKPNETAAEEIAKIRVVQNKIPKPKAVNLGMKPFRK